MGWALLSAFPCSVPASAGLGSMKQVLQPRVRYVDSPFVCMLDLLLDIYPVPGTLLGTGASRVPKEPGVGCGKNQSALQLREMLTQPQGPVGAPQRGCLTRESELEAGKVGCKWPGDRARSWWPWDDISKAQVPLTVTTPHGRHLRLGKVSWKNVIQKTRQESRSETLLVFHCWRDSV